MLTNILEIDQATYRQLLDFNIENGGNLFVFGPAGIGKTMVAIQAAHDMGYEVGYLNLSVLESPDMTGLPIIDKETLITTYASPAFLPLKDQNKDKKPIVLLADEMDKALPELQNPCLELFQFRKINGRPLNVHAVIATGNRPDENAHTNLVSHALTDRCQVYALEHKFEPWLEWATANGVNSLVTLFLDKNKDFLLRPDQSGDPTAYCHPTPRSWSRAAQDLDILEAKGASIDLKQIIMAGWVGSEAAVKFRVWLEYYKDMEPMIDKWLKDGTHPQPDSPDKLMVCCVAGLNELAETCRIQPTNPKEAENKKRRLAKTVEYVCHYLQGIQEDFLVGSIRATLNKKMIKENKLSDYNAFSALFSKVLKAWNDHDIIVKK